AEPVGAIRDRDHRTGPTIEESLHAAVEGPDRDDSFASPGGKLVPTGSENRPGRPSHRLLRPRSGPAGARSRGFRRVDAIGPRARLRIGVPQLDRRVLACGGPKLAAR